MTAMAQHPFFFAMEVPHSRAAASHARVALCVRQGCTYIADTGHHRICVLKDGVLSVLAGSGARGCWDGRGQEAMFAHPCGLTISPEGTIFVRAASCEPENLEEAKPATPRPLTPLSLFFFVCRLRTAATTASGR